MSVKPCILIGQQHLKIEGVDILNVYRQPPTSVLDLKRAKQYVTAVDYKNRRVSDNRWRVGIGDQGFQAGGNTQ